MMNSEHLAQQGANRTWKQFCLLLKIENLKVVLAVLATLELKEDALLKGSKALGADKAPCVKQISVRVDRLPVLVESLLAVRAVASRGVRCLFFLTMQCFPILNNAIFCSMFFNF